MGRSFVLEVFETRQPRQPNMPEPSQDPAQIAAELEEARLQAFEKGYKEGWSDAAASQNDEEKRIGAELARNLQDLGFTLHEARNHVLNEMEALLTEIVTVALPKISGAAIGQSIVEAVLPVAEQTSEAEIEVVVSPADRAAVEALLREQNLPSVRVAEEGTLAEGQAYLRLGQVEKEIEFREMNERITASIAQLFKKDDSSERFTANG